MRQPMIFMLAASLLLAACSSVNQDIQVPDGEFVDGSLASVNGRIEVGTDSRVSGGLANVNGRITTGPGSQVGDIRNVNGPISIGRTAQTGSIETVNGALSIGESSTINGAVSSVNGSISTGPQALVLGPVSSVNGPIQLADGTRVHGLVSSTNGLIRLHHSQAGGIETSRGSVELLDGSVIAGGLRVKPAGPGDRGLPRIVIGAGTRVEGAMEFEREVLLYVHETAGIGPVSGAEILFFSEGIPRIAE